MFEVRSFQGDAEELHRFVVGNWRRTYAGEMPFGLWSADYFDWQFGLSEGLARDHLITAYEGSRIVGTLLGIPFRFHHQQREFTGTLGSWLTVDPDMGRQGIGSKMREELFRVHQAQGMDGQLGYIYLGSKSAQGNPFWKKKPGQGRLQRVKELGFWARVLNPRRAAPWNYNRAEAWLTRLSAPLVFALRPTPCTDVRPYRPGDLPACVELARHMSLATDLGILWDAENLGRQLEGRGVGKCMVYEGDGGVRGFCAYHLLPMLGRTEEPVGVIDMIATGSLPAKNAAALVNHCLHDMRQQGAILVTKLRGGDASWKALARCGFVPTPADHSLAMSWVDASREFPRIRSTHMLWR
jgi:hypothetical protein